MRIDFLNWMQVEARLRTDDRCVLPLGCTEQHAYLSLSTDSILAENDEEDPNRVKPVTQTEAVHGAFTHKFPNASVTVIEIPMQ